MRESRHSSCLLCRTIICKISVSLEIIFVADSLFSKLALAIKQDIIGVKGDLREAVDENVMKQEGLYYGSSKILARLNLIVRTVI